VSSLRQDTWLRAEASLQKPQIVARAATALPNRAAVILRALDALQRNDLHTLRALRDEADTSGLTDLGACLALLSAAPASPEAAAALDRADALPATAPGAALLKDTLRRLDAVRAKPLSADDAEAAFSDEPPSQTTSPTPAADALRALLSTSPLRPQSRPDLAARVCPRADHVQIAAAALIVFGECDDATVESYCAQPSQLDLDSGAWIDAGAESYSPFVAWCADLDMPWSADQDDALNALGFFGDEERNAPYQRLVLGAMLRRVRRAIDAGKLASVLPVIVDALGWASQSRALPVALRQQCVALSDRVAWLSDDAPSPPFIQALWRARAPSLHKDARIAIARQAEEMQPTPETDPLRLECVCYLIAHLTDIDEVCAIIEDHFTAEDRAALTQGLRTAQAPADRAAFALGLHAALSGLTAQALDQALSFVSAQPTEPEPATTYCVEIVLRALANIQDRTHPLPPSIKRSLTEIIARLTSLSFRAHPKHCPSLLLLFQSSSYGLTSEASELIRASTLAAPLVHPADLGQNDGALDLLTAQTAALGLLNDPAAQDALKLLGRALRKLPNGDEADLLALRAAAQLASWLPLNPPSLRDNYLDPISKFLLRDGNGERATTAAQRLPTLPPGLTEWYLIHRVTLGSPDIWHPIIFQALEIPTDPVPEYLLKILAEVLETQTILTTEQLLSELFLAANEHSDQLLSGNWGDDDDYEDDDDEDFDDDED
jgi:hypothetical protein